MIFRVMCGGNVLLITLYFYCLYEMSESLVRDTKVATSAN